MKLHKKVVKNVVHHRQRLNKVVHKHAHVSEDLEDLLSQLVVACAKLDINLRMGRMQRRIHHKIAN
jgi:hypothetical protein